MTGVAPHAGVAPFPVVGPPAEVGPHPGIPALVPRPAAAPAPAPPAYPHPVVVSPPPKGDPAAARELASAYRGLAEAVDQAGRRAVLVLERLAAEWTGEGSATRRVASAAIAADAATASRGLRGIADHLDAYAARLEAARHHHGWSLGRLLAVGAVVAVTATAVVVTVGVAAPVGSLAAAEVAEALAGAEGAAAAGAAAESAAAGGIGECAGLLSGLRGLTAVLRPHLAQGIVSAVNDLATQIGVHHRFDPWEVADALLGGTALSIGVGGALTAVRSSARYAALSTDGRVIAESVAVGAVDTGFSAGHQFLEHGHVDVTKALSFGVTGSVLHGWAQFPAQLTGYEIVPSRPPARGQRVDDLLTRVRLGAHEGSGRGGHTLRRHVAKSPAWLDDRLRREGRVAASTFFDRRTAEYAVTAALRAEEASLRRQLAAGRSFLVVRHELPAAPGFVAYANGRREPSRVICVKLRRRGELLVVVTAYLEERLDIPGARTCGS